MATKTVCTTFHDITSVFFKNARIVTFSTLREHSVALRLPFDVYRCMLYYNAMKLAHHAQ